MRPLPRRPEPPARQVEGCETPLRDAAPFLVTVPPPSPDFVRERPKRGELVPAWLCYDGAFVRYDQYLLLRVLSVSDPTSGHAAHAMPQPDEFAH